MAAHLGHHKIADLLELKRVLGTDTPLAVFGKQKQLDYRASDRHRARFYTLAEIARFDDRGLSTPRSAGAFASSGSARAAQPDGNRRAVPLYAAIDLPQRRHQILARRSAQGVPFVAHSEALQLSRGKLKAALFLFYGLLAMTAFISSSSVCGLPRLHSNGLKRGRDIGTIS